MNKPTYEELAAQVERLRCTLVNISKWNSHSTDYAVNFGSNGVRDFYRAMADKALSETPGQSLEALKAEWQAESVKSLVSDCAHWSVMGEWAILVSDIAEKLERLEKIRQRTQEKQQ